MISKKKDWQPAIFLDPAKASDTDVNHYQLVTKLEKIGIKGVALNLFKWYLPKWKKAICQRRRVFKLSPDCDMWRAARHSPGANIIYCIWNNIIYRWYSYFLFCWHLSQRYPTELLLLETKLFNITPIFVVLVIYQYNNSKNHMPADYIRSNTQNIYLLKLPKMTKTIGQKHFGYVRIKLLIFMMHSEVDMSNETFIYMP